MPELAEVEFYRKVWNPGLGQKVMRVHVNPKARVYRGEVPESFAGGLTGAVFQASSTHGKNMLFTFSRQLWLGGHLGMTGELICAPPDHAPTKHDHLVLFQKSQTLIFRDPRMFGRLRIHEGKLPPSWWQELPPGILSKDYTLSKLSSVFSRQLKTPIKALLLDQRYFPGIGNWMADEILWRLQLSPAMAAGSVPTARLPDLLRELRKLCRQALKTIGETWADPPDSWLFNHRWKAGGHCPRCQEPLSRADLRGRTCCWCERCQPTE